MTVGSDVQIPEGQPPEGHPAAKPKSRWASVLARILRSKITRLGFVLIVVALLVAALVDQGGSLWHDIQKLSGPTLLLAFVAQLGALAASMMLWRVLLADFGSPISLTDAWRINFVAQLGKYMPGKVWQIVAQAEMSKDLGVPRERSALSALLALVLTLVTGALVGAATLPFSAGGAFTRYLWFLLIVPLGFAALCPPVMNRMLRLALKILKRPPLEKGVSLKGLLHATAWSLLQWVLFGLTTFVLLYQLGDHHPDAFVVATGAYALSWVVGFLALIAPAGIGAREAVLIAALSSRTTASNALALALLTRGLAVVGDAVTGLSAAALMGRGRIQRLRAARTSKGLPTNS